MNIGRHFCRKRFWLAMSLLNLPDLQAPYLASNFSTKARSQALKPMYMASAK